MVDTNKIRVSGNTAAEDAAEEQAKDADNLVDTSLERTRKFRTPGFQRMRTDWNSEDTIILERAKKIANEKLFLEFKDGFNILSWIYDIVRDPVTNEDGEIEIDDKGRVVYKRNEYGVYEEDYSRLTNRERDNLLFTIATRLFGWEQKAADIWQEAMQSKGQWIERNAIGFDAPMSGTQGDREAAANKDSAEERYFAVFVSTYSRKADAFVSNMKNLQNILLKSLAR